MIQYPKRYRRIPVRSVESQHPRRSLFGKRSSLRSGFDSSSKFQQPHAATYIESLDHQDEPDVAELHPNGRDTATPVEPETLQTTNNQTESETSADDQPNWQEIATKLQGEMNSFRKRQLRQAEEATGQERERLLRLILPTIDNLQRALNHQGTVDDNLRQGVELTYREFMRLMAAEGVTKVDSVGQPFDPNLHEALATKPHRGEPDIVVDEIEAGYRLDDKLLRPAKVVVAA